MFPFMVVFFGEVGLDFSLLPLSLLRGTYSCACLKFPVGSNLTVDIDFLRVLSVSIYILLTKG